MGSFEAENPERDRAEDGDSQPAQHKRWRWLRFALFGLFALTIAAGLATWLSREQIAGNFIDDYLAQNNLTATYDIARISPQRQVIENLVIGDPLSPNLTIRRIVVEVEYGFGAPQIGLTTVEGARLFGSYRDGVLSFGALDKLLFADTEEPQGLPELDLKLIDAGALLETDYGNIGASLNGSGMLDDGFAGKLAVTAPGMDVEGCSAQTLTAFGDLTTRDGAPRFGGPVRLRNAQCGGATLQAFDATANLSTDDRFARFNAGLNMALGRFTFGQYRAAAGRGTASLTYKDGALRLKHDVGLRNIATPFGSVASLSADGTLRSADNFARNDWNADIHGEGGDFTQGANGALAAARSGTEGTLIAPLLAKLERNLAAATRRGTMDGEVTWRLHDGAQSIFVPQARLRSARGETVLAVSRLGWSSAGASGTMRGNFITGGTGLPQMTGRMEQDGSGALALRMTMAEYRDGANRLALPRFSMRQQPSGDVTFSGTTTASGDLPGGFVQGLVLPLNGRFDTRNGLRLGMQCETVRFASLSLYQLTLRGRATRLCPVGARAMVQVRDALSVAAQTQNLALTGELAETPATIKAARAVLRYPGPFALDDLTAVLGPQDNLIYLDAATLTGTLDDEIGGEFAGASARLAAVPLDLSQMAGRWSYAGQSLNITDAIFTLTERIEGQARFEPLVSEGAKLSLADNTITADATLRHRASGTAITDVQITHDLNTSKGSALIAVDRLTFGKNLRLDDLTYLAKGVIAYTEGSVSGTGRIDWTGDDITSSGVFRSDGLDLAAAFGPIRGLRGEVRFTDLINLTTAPGQVIEIGAVNPGIEVLDGRVQFSMTGGEVISIEDGRWPFMGGQLIVRPVTLRYGSEEGQRYVFEMIALDAAKFVAQMELSNLGATGLFDGTVPIAFDSQGNGRIEGGLLISRPPGGNVSYIGELTYEDLGAITNYAFQSLRSLDYSQMSVQLNGDLAGEIITRFQFDGISQGEGASSNFITKRLARLPIRFNVNVRSENFYELATMVRTFWDPEALPDPVDQGVLKVDGRRFVPRAPSGNPPVPPEPPPAGNPTPVEPRRPDDLSVQPPESDNLP